MPGIARRLLTALAVVASMVFLVMGLISLLNSFDFPIDGPGWRDGMIGTMLVTVGLFLLLLVMRHHRNSE